MTAKWSDYVAGAVLTAANLNDTVDNFQDVAIFSEDQASGTEGGGSTSGSFAKRTLNTTRVNNITGCSISSSVITLTQAGTYYFRGTCPAFKPNGCQVIIRNTTASSNAIVGQTNYFSSADNVMAQASVEGVVTITASTNFELQQRVGSSVAANGLGAAQSFGVGEVYSQLYIRRIA